MTTFRKKLSIFNLGKKKEFRLSQGNKKPSLILGTYSSLIKRKSVFINKKNKLLFQNVLSEQNGQYTSEQINEYNKIISLLIKEPYNRTKEENKEIGDFLSNNFNVFQLLKEKDEEKYEIIISICHLKRYSQNNIIINYENILDKTFFLLEGKLIVYKPIFIRKLMTQEKFMISFNILNNKDIDKYNRIKEKNKEILSEIKYDNNRKKLRQFFVEENKKVGEIEEGQNFGGEIDDYNNEKKNSELMVKTVDDSLILFFNLDYYRKILNKIERKKFKEEIEKYRKHFIIFQNIADSRMIEMFKKFSSQTLYQDEYLYHQNEPSDYIYFVIKGKLCKYASFSFNWLLEYLDYIKDATTNAIYHLIKLFPKNQVEHDKLISELEEKKLESPMINIQLSKIEKIKEKNFEKNIYGVKSEEENINNNQNIFRIKLENIGIGDNPGIEDGLEFKNRLYSVKCISEIAEVKKIKVSDFLRIIKISKNENNYANNHILGLIAQKKFFLYNQIVKNAQHLEIKLTSDFDAKYNNLIEPNEKTKSDKDKNLTIAAIKAKGYKHDIKEIFDKEIPIFPKIKKSLSENYFLQNQIILKNLYENPAQKVKGLFKFKKQKRNLTLSLSNPNYYNSNEIIPRKNFFSEENSNSKFNINNYNSPNLSRKSKFSITLTTNFSKKSSVKAIKRLKSIFFNSKKSENKEIKKLENEKNENDAKELKMGCIESLLNETFGKNNKKYYLGSEFKKMLDDEKKKFNLIRYKEFFNK